MSSTCTLSPFRTNRGGFEDEARLVVREPAALHEAGVVGEFKPIITLLFREKL